MIHQGPVPPGLSPALEGAMTGPCHAAVHDVEEMTWSELRERTIPPAAGWPGGDPPDLSGEEPPAWLEDDDCDPGDWDYLALAARADADGTADRERRLRLLGNDVGTGYAHHRGETPLPGPHAGPARHFGQGMAYDLMAADPALAVLAEEA